MSEARIPALEAALKNNPKLQADLKADPRKVLGDFGVDLTPDDADRLKDLLSSKGGPGMANPHAVYVAIKI